MTYYVRLKLAGGRWSKAHAVDKFQHVTRCGRSLAGGSKPSSAGLLCKQCDRGPVMRQNADGTWS